MTLVARLKFLEKTIESTWSMKTLTIQSSSLKVRRKRTKRLKIFRLKFRVWEKIMTARCNGCMSRCKWWKLRWKNWLKKEIHQEMRILLIIKIVALAITIITYSHSRGEHRLFKRSQSKLILCKNIDRLRQHVLSLLGVPKESRPTMELPSTLEGQGITK